MLIQTLVLIAAMVVVSGAVFTSTLVTAKASLHQAALAKAQTAMADAQSAFTQWAAQQVARYGTEAWRESAGSATENPCSFAAASSDAAGVSSPQACPFVASLTWKVAGMSATPGLGSTTALGQTVARNLATTVDEQRVSATLTVRITNATGTTLLASRSREVTARIFDAQPYAVITGTRDIAAMAGSIHAAQGDTAGMHEPTGLRHSQGTPDGRFPSAYENTLIATSIDCTNTLANSSLYFQSNPYVNKAQWLDASLRPYGNRDWAEETPCSPGYAINTTGAPPDYSDPRGNVYITVPRGGSIDWNDGIVSATSFPH